jgi:hypothetical protein
MKNGIFIILLLIISIYSVSHLLSSSFIPTHDGEYHIVRFWQFDKVIKDGIFIPTWAPDLNYGFGVPVFSFFYPLTNYIGEVFHLIGFSYIDSVKLVLASGVIISTLGFYIFLRLYFNNLGSFVGSVAYAIAPYHIVVASIRGSIGEIWALAIIPFVLFGTTIVFTKQKISFYIVGGLSLLISLLLLSHNVLGLILLGFNFMYGFYCYLFLGKSRINEFMIAHLLAFLVTSFFFVPLFIERNYVTGLDIVNYRDHFVSLFQLLFPSWGSGFSVPGISDQISFQLGIPHILALFLTFIFLYKTKHKASIFFLVSTFIFVFLMVENSRVIWERLSFLRFMQFPWRLLSVTLICSSFLIGFIASYHKSLGIIILVLCFAFYVPYTNAVRYEKRPDSLYTENPNWKDGTTTVGNSFSILNFNKSAISQKDEFHIVSGDAVITRQVRKSYISSARVESKSDSLIEVKRALYPGWMVYMDSHKVPLAENSQGILSFVIPSGRHSIIVKFGQTPIRAVSLWVSTVTVVGICLFSIKTLYENRTRYLSS